jgi:hypothetical protein
LLVRKRALGREGWSCGVSLIVHRAGHRRGRLVEEPRVAARDLAVEARAVLGVQRAARVSERRGTAGERDRDQTPAAREGELCARLSRGSHFRATAAPRAACAQPRDDALAEIRTREHHGSERERGEHREHRALRRIERSAEGNREESE